MQALARESRLKIRLQELVTTLEQVTRNAEARLLEGREIVQDLNHSNRYFSCSQVILLLVLLLKMLVSKL